MQFYGSLVLTQQSCVCLTCVDNVKPLQFLRVGPQWVYSMELQYMTHTVTLLETQSPSSASALLLVPQLWVAKQFDTPQTSMGIGAILSLECNYFAH